jgi:hypothetical protein
VINSIEPSLKKHKGWHGRVINANDDEERINKAIGEMNEAFDRFTVSIPREL